MAFEGGIKVRILGDDSDLQKTLRESTVQIAKYGAAAAAAGAAVTAAFVSRGLAAADAQAKLAKQLDTSSASMATLSRAAGLSGVSFEKITSGTRQLTVRLSQAASGAGPAAEMLERLGLSAEFLASVPLDQRIDAINQAILTNIPATERAAAGAALFGEEAGLAFRQISGETLRQAAEDAELFGTALTEVEARNVERAVDAMSNFSTAASGASMQLAEELSPVLTAVGNSFREMLDEMGGMDEVAETTATAMTDSFLFVIDAVAGIQRAFELAGKGLATYAIGAQIAMGEVHKAVLDLIDGPIDRLITTLNLLPGIDIPMLSNATEAVGGRLDMLKGAYTEATEDLAEVLGRPLPSESLREAIELAREANDLMSGAGEGEDEESAGALGPITLPPDFYDEQLENLKKYGNQRQEIEKQISDAMILEADRRTQELKEKEEADAAARVGIYKSMFGNLSTLMNTENRKLFEIGKAAATANALINAYESITSSFRYGSSIGGPVLGAAFASTAAAAQFATISSIQSAQFGGGGGASGSVTQSINDASTPVASAGGQGSTASGGQGPTTVINLSGDTFGRRQVRDLLEQLNEEGRNGGRLVIA